MDIPGVEPIPVDPNNPDTAGDLDQQPQPQTQGDQPPGSGVDESVQPFPAGSRPTSGGGSSSSGGGSSTGGPAGGSAGYACGRRIVHVVQPGQNIFRIALRYDTTINAIVWRNGIDDVRFVRPGTRLVVVTCEQR
jgi:LysM repeat protein